MEHLNNLSGHLSEYFDLWRQHTTSEDLDPAIRDYFKASKFAFPILWDEEQTLVRRFKALKTPHVSLLKRAGENEYKTVVRRRFEPSVIIQKLESAFLPTT